jgi:hypothetical protein
VSSEIEPRGRHRATIVAPVLLITDATAPQTSARPAPGTFTVDDRPARNQIRVRIFRAGHHEDWTFKRDLRLPAFAGLEDVVAPRRLDAEVWAAVVALRAAVMAA